jgi:hypothetical protein
VKLNKELVWLAAQLDIDVTRLASDAAIAGAIFMYVQMVESALDQRISSVESVDTQKGGGEDPAA